MMEFYQYENAAKSTAVYPGEGTIEGVSYCTHGLCGEAGEVAGKVKKVMRGDRSLSAAREDILLEMGDVLWYLSELSINLGSSLTEIANMNIRKLAQREIKGTVRGDGDHR